MSQENVAPNSPALAVVLAMPGPFVTVRKTLKHLQAQTACKLIELLTLVVEQPHLEAAAEHPTS
jgi:hypothetical protein